MHRRNFLQLSLAAPFTTRLVGAAAPGEGLTVPDGFTVREIALAGEVVAGTDYTITIEAGTPA
jgi:hypothetical protein